MLASSHEPMDFEIRLTVTVFSSFCRDKSQKRKRNNFFKDFIFISVSLCFVWFFFFVGMVFSLVHSFDFSLHSVVACVCALASDKWIGRASPRATMKRMPFFWKKNYKEIATMRRLVVTRNMCAYKFSNVWPAQASWMCDAWTSICHVKRIAIFFLSLFHSSLASAFVLLLSIHALFHCLIENYLELSQATKKTVFFFLSLSKIVRLYEWIRIYVRCVHDD